ncbi:G-protein coupled receptor 151 [Bufo gargarizans]|uniref:G-protein coupled receptor 151 n=1 Tax=Bufo gargarizans TaxID=30331 RepID=UPI001CF51F15|nr:G-protein coupled receptor 151 [Bufo gargarizans]
MAINIVVHETQHECNQKRLEKCLEKSDRVNSAILSLQDMETNFSTMNSFLSKQTLYAFGFQPLDLGEWTFVIPTILVLICLLGLAGNLCVISIFLYNSRKAKPSLIHSLILNISISDLMLLMFSVPFRAAVYSRSTLTVGWFMCRTADWFIHVCMSVKSFTTAIVARSCFIYASNPAKQVTIPQITICAVMTSTWVVASVLPLPECFFTDAKQNDSSVICLINIPSQSQKMMDIFVELYPLFVYFIPFTSAFFYFWRAYGQCQRRGTKTQNLRNQMRSRRLTIMLLSVTVTFCIMWLPEWISWFWFWHQPLRGPPHAFRTLAQVLMLSLSCINPFIFLVMLEEFKEGFKDICSSFTSKKSLVVKDKDENDVKDKGTLTPEIQPDSTSSQDLVLEHPTTNGSVEPSCSQQKLGRQDSKEIPVLPDVEQFWNEREANLSDENNDPIPWEHEDKDTVGSEKFSTKICAQVI